MTKVYAGWAFKAVGWPDTPTRAFLAGIYCFDQWRLERTGGPVGTALFETRREARAAAKKAHLRGRAVKVLVTIEVIK